jgi:hypothetical protein
VQEAKDQVRQMNKQLHTLQNNVQELNFEMKHKQNRFIEEHERAEQEIAFHQQLVHKAVGKVVEQHSGLQESHQLHQLHLQTQARHLHALEQKSKLQGTNKQKNAWSEEAAFVTPRYLKALKIPDFGRVSQHEWIEPEQASAARKPSRSPSRYSLDRQNSLNAITYMNELLVGKQSGHGSGGMGHQRQTALPLSLKESTVLGSTPDVRQGSQLSMGAEQPQPHYRPVTPQPNLKQISEVNVSELAQPQPSGLPQESKTPTISHQNQGVRTQIKRQFVYKV